MKLPTHRPPSHPGVILLEEFLDAYDPPVTQVQAAKRLGWSFLRLNQLINEKRGVSAENALDLAALTGTSAAFWLNLQNAYDLWHADQYRKRKGTATSKPPGKTTGASHHRPQRDRLQPRTSHL